MARKAITKVRGSELSNLEDKEAIITVLLKRMCTFEEAVDFLLSAIPETIQDDILGELTVWDNRVAEMRRIREEKMLAHRGEKINRMKRR
jgi:hypothetical protein